MNNDDLSAVLKQHLRYADLRGADLSGAEFAAPDGSTYRVPMRCDTWREARAAGLIAMHEGDYPTAKRCHAILVELRRALTEELAAPTGAGYWNARQPLADKLIAQWERERP